MLCASDSFLPCKRGTASKIKMYTPFLYEGTAIFINLLNFSNIISVIVPILLSVAFMTIIERKMLAAMQRRLGPTDVGLDYTMNKDYCKLSFPSRTHLPFSNVNKPLLAKLKRVSRGGNNEEQGKRFFHINSFLYKSWRSECSQSATNIVNVLYKNRIDNPLIPFNSSTGAK